MNRTRFHPQAKGVRRLSTEVPQYQVEAEECEDDSNDKDVHILRAGRKKG